MISNTQEKKAKNHHHRRKLMVPIYISVEKNNEMNITKAYLSRDWGDYNGYWRRYWRVWDICRQAGKLGMQWGVRKLIFLRPGPTHLRLLLPVAPYFYLCKQIFLSTRRQQILMFTNFAFCEQIWTTICYLNSHGVPIPILKSGESVSISAKNSAM